MKPNELRNILLKAPRTKENFERIPESAHLVWILHPNSSQRNDARFWRNIRRVLIVASLLYIVVAQRWNELALYLWFTVAAYEYAYSRSAEVVTNLASRQAEARYIDRVNEHLEKSYPGYKAPANEISIFSVLPYMDDRDY